MEELIVNDVRNSFGRCTYSPGFLDDFYDNFLSKSPEIAEKFKNTDFAKQKEALKQGLGFLILFAKDHSVAKKKIAELGISHNKSHLNIRPDMYPLWQSALLETVEKHDKQFNFDLKNKWIQVITFGISAIKSAYNS